MIVIGCDPSTKQPAFAVYEDKKLVDFKKIKADFNVISPAVRPRHLWRGYKAEN